MKEKGCSMPPKKDGNETIFTYYIDNATVDWKLAKPEEWIPPSGKGSVNFSALLIPTLDSYRCE